MNPGPLMKSGTRESVSCKHERGKPSARAVWPDREGLRGASVIVRGAASVAAKTLTHRRTPVTSLPTSPPTTGRARRCRRLLLRSYGSPGPTTRSGCRRSCTSHHEAGGMTDARGRRPYTSSTTTTLPANDTYLVGQDVKHSFAPRWCCPGLPPSSTAWSGVQESTTGRHDSLDNRVRLLRDGPHVLQSALAGPTRMPIETRRGRPVRDAVASSATAAARPAPARPPRTTYDRQEPRPRCRTKPSR